MNICAVRTPSIVLYRVHEKSEKSYIGPGSFWAENPDVAYEYGVGDNLITTVVLPDEPVADVQREDDIIDLLGDAGIDANEAAHVFYDSDWLEPPYRDLLAKKYAWVRKPIGDTRKIEWVRMREISAAAQKNVSVVTYRGHRYVALTR